MRKNIFTALMILVSASTFAFIYVERNERSIDDNYSLKFDTRSAEGTFSGLTGTVTFNPNNLTSALIDISVDARTIKTGNDKKDEHANGEDWLDTKAYPNILFKSHSFKGDGNTFTVIGDLTLHGVTKQVEVPFYYSEETGTFKGEFFVNRKDHGIDGGGLKAIFVGEDIEISFHIPTSLKQD